MKHNHHEKIKKVCFDIFEQLAFMFAEEIDLGEIEGGDEPLIHAAMSFSGNTLGTIDITMPVTLASQLAKNILGLDESESVDQQHYEDAVCELLNTICGRMLTSLFGEDVVFDLHVPSTQRIEAQHLTELLATGDCIAFSVEDMPVLVRTFL